MPFGLPKSLLWFVVTGVVFVLQAIPFTGIFLMLVAAPLWSVALINIGFVSLAIEALFKPRHIIWLVAPVVYFAGYAGAAHFSHQQFASIDAGLRAENAAASKGVFRFDPAEHDLIVEKTSYHLSGIASMLVRNYPVNVVYETSKNHKTASHVAYRLATPAVCQAVRDNPAAGGAAVRATFIRDKAGKSGWRSRRRKPLACRLMGPADPTRPAVRIFLERRKTRDWLLPATYDTLTLQDERGATRVVRTGFAAPLPWLPMPAMGCALNSARPAWVCDAAFMRLGKKGLGGAGAYGRANAPAIAAALGLSEVPLASRMATTSDEVPTSLTETIEKRLQMSSANLDRIIADPTVRLTVHDLSGLRDRPDIWRERIPAMTATLIRTLDGGYATRERASILQGLLNRLPAADYSTVARDLVQALRNRREPAHGFLRDETLTRLGDLGEEALPVLDIYLFEKRGVINHGALLGLCRVGNPAASRASRIIDYFEIKSETYLSPEKRFAAYLTLHRLGHAEIADIVLSDTGRPSRGVLDAVSRTVSPASAADVCVRLGDWQRRTRRRRR